MNASLKAAAEAARANLFHPRTALFHSTPVLKRRRRNHWQPFDCWKYVLNVQRFNYSKRPRPAPRYQWKHNVMRNFNTYADDFFQSWIPFLEHQEVPHNRGPSWFTRDQGGNGSTRQANPNQGNKARRTRGFDFCSDDGIDAETIFRSAFGGERISFWSFMNEDKAHWRSSSGYTNGRRGSSRHWSFDSDGDEDSSSDTDGSESTLESQRLVLGLSPYGPLKLDDIKHAYRTCALKYHPDRHQGPSKNAAEEKFKLCTAAYQSLCDKLAAVN